MSVTTLVATPDPDDNENNVKQLAENPYEIERHDALAQTVGVMDVFWTLAERVAKTELARGYRGRAEAVFSMFMKGREVGLQPMQSLDAIDVIQGVPTLKPEVMRAVIRQHGHDYRIDEMSDERCVMSAHRREWPADRWSRFEFNTDDAKAMKLLDKDNWRKQVAVMLFARCTSKMGRAEFADVLHGLSYTPEEIMDTIETTATVIPQPPTIVEAEPTRDLTSEIETLDAGAKAALRAWWKTSMPRGVTSAAVPTSLAPSVLDKIGALRNEFGLDPDDDDPSGAPAENDGLLQVDQPPANRAAGEVIDAEVIEEPPARTVTPPPAAKTPPAAKDWQEVLKAQFREMSIPPPKRPALASRCLGREIQRISQLNNEEAEQFSRFLDSGELERQVQVAFPGAEEVDA